jgi:hypothetical protein
VPFYEINIGNNRVRAYDSFQPEMYTIPYKLLGASTEGDFYSAYQVEVTDVSEIADEIKLRYADTAKDYISTEVTYHNDYHITDYRKPQATSVSTDLALPAANARQIAENIMQKAYDTNRLFTVHIAPSAYGNIFIGQRLIIDLDETGNQIQLLVSKIIKGLDYTMEVQGFIYADKILPESGTSYGGYPDDNYEVLPTDPPVITPDNALASGALKVYDLPFLAPTTMGKLGCWVAIDDLGFADGTILKIWYKIGINNWVNSGQTIKARGKFGTIASTPSFNLAYENNNQLTLTFDSTIWSLVTLSDNDFNNRLGNLAIIGDTGSNTDNFLTVIQNATLSGTDYLLSTLQVAAFNQLDNSPLNSTATTSSTRILFYGTGRQAWFSLPTAAINETVAVACATGDPSTAPFISFLFTGRSYQAPNPIARKSYRQANSDWLLTWSAVDIYDQVWEEGSDNSLADLQFYTIEIFPDDSTFVPVRVYSTTSLSFTYPLADQITDGLDTANAWLWKISATYTGFTLGTVSAPTYIATTI